MEKKFEVARLEFFRKVSQLEGSSPSFIMLILHVNKLLRFFLHVKILLEILC